MYCGTGHAAGVLRVRACFWRKSLRFFRGALGRLLAQSGKCIVSALTVAIEGEATALIRPLAVLMTRYGPSVSTIAGCNVIC